MITDQDRLSAWDELSGLAHDIVKRSDNFPGLFERMQTLSRFALVSPIPKGQNIAFNLIHRSNGAVVHTDLKIFLRFPEDEEIPMVRSQKIFSPEIGLHHEPLHMLILNMAADTLKRMAFALIHELGHARLSEQRGTAFTGGGRTRDEFIREELAMRDFDCNLLLALGNGEYHSKVYRGVRREEEFRKRKSISETDLQVHNRFFEGMGASLSQFYGLPATGKAAQMRDSEFQLYCELKSAAKNLTGEDLEKFRFIIMESYYSKLL